MTGRLDPRLNAVRPDLADARLEGQVEAERFVAGRPARVSAPTAPLRRAPRPDAEIMTEALYGETLAVFEQTAEGWAWVQLDADRYVGWCAVAALSAPGPAATHRVATLGAHLYPEPDIKRPPLAALPYRGRVAVAGARGEFRETVGGFLHVRHLAPLEAVDDDPVAVAARFIGTPYLWGGKTSHGLDCSGLIQLAFEACGLACPRDSDMQRAGLGGTLGTALGAEAWREARRGDLVFWKGHVGIVAGDGRLIHANAHHMAVVAEPLGPAVARIAAAGLAVVEVRRP